MRRRDGSFRSGRALILAGIMAIGCTDSGGGNGPIGGKGGTGPGRGGAGGRGGTTGAAATGGAGGTQSNAGSGGSIAGAGGAAGNAGAGGSIAGAGGTGAGGAGTGGAAGAGTGGAGGAAAGEGGAGGIAGTGGVAPARGGAGGGTAGSGGSAGGAGAGVAGAGGDTGGAGGGTGGTAGAAGAGAIAGIGGLGGSTGAGGRFTCSSDLTFDCANGALTLTNGHVTAFSPDEYSPLDGRTCNASGLRARVFSYSGPVADGGNISSNAHGVDAAAGNFRLTLMAGPGGYAGGGLSFDRCVNASPSNAIRFTAWLAGGDQLNCTFKVLLQTFEQFPSIQNPPGGCDTATMSCYNFPASPSVALTTTPTTFTVPFSMLTAGATHAMPIPGQVIGLQWQLDAGAQQAACSVEVRIDDIDFVAP